VLVLPDAQASSFVGYHNLDAISDALVKKSIGVKIARDPDFVKGFGEDSAWQEMQVRSSLSSKLHHGASVVPPSSLLPVS